MLPAYGFRDESIYQIDFKATNQERTFEEIKTIDFVPISCQYFMFKDEGAVFEKTVEDPLTSKNYTLEA